jgi:hypothetical protein
MTSSHEISENQFKKHDEIFHQVHLHVYNSRSKMLVNSSFTTETTQSILNGFSGNLADLCGQENQLK